MMSDKKKELKRKIEIDRTHFFGLMEAKIEKEESMRSTEYLLNILFNLIVLFIF